MLSCLSAAKHGPERGCARADYFFNSTSPPTGEEKFVATKTKVLFNISGSQEAPVKDITIRGLEIRDTAYTYLGTDTADLHGMPSGGDCAHHPPILSSLCFRSESPSWL